MAKNPKKAPRLTQAEQEERAAANRVIKRERRKLERQRRAQKALKMVELAKARGIPLTAGAACAYWKNATANTGACAIVARRRRSPAAWNACKSTSSRRVDGSCTATRQAA
ncbi:hypothetical protein [Citrobacter portucalensis]|uniref:hypothetical protein n=1 Tax=Citrobacter portucalensis TaxID=1639133 RepID=UPI00226B3C55|nr:hypothetical protein [Citrobacter portucalensis]MCX8985160.1 hypothetical protein [Citrobacter portucalensis]